MTPDPTSAAPDTVAALVLGALVALLGPLLGQVVLILVAAFLGGLLALSRATTPTLWSGLKLLARGMGLAMLVGGAGSVVWLGAFGDGSYAESLAIVSALIGFRTEWALERVAAWTERRTGGNA